MKNPHKQLPSPIASRKRSMGFSLIELMVAMAIFLVVGGAAVGLLRTHAPLFAAQQGQAGLNVGMRNAVAQMQLDVVNAGSGFYPGANMPFFPVGITITNTATYDKLNVITVDDTVPPAHPSGNSAGTVDAKTDSQDLWLVFTGVTPAPTNAQLTTWATTIFKQGTELLLVQGGSDFNNVAGPKMTTVILTSAVGDVQGNSIHMQHALTTAAGVPLALPEPFGIITLGDEAKCTNDFNPNQDYVMKIQGVTYAVDTSVATNPKLVRVPLGTAIAGSPNVIAEQIAGFKVGAWSSPWSQNAAAAAGALANDPTASNFYSFDSTQYNNDWTSIRAVRINLTGQTPPNSNPGNTVSTQMISVVINPRNLSM